MTAREFTGLLIEIGNKGRIFHIRAALSKEKLLPTYKDPMTETSAAWYLLTYFVCPHSDIKTVISWLKSKRQEWEKMPKYQHPINMISTAILSGALNSAHTVHADRRRCDLIIVTKSHCFNPTAYVRKDFDSFISPLISFHYDFPALLHNSIYV